MEPSEERRRDDLPSEPINGRYRIVRRLGRGGMGTVYLVHDARTGDRPLALKCIRRDRMDPRTLAILRNEFLSLAALPHPNLARVYEFGIDRRTSDYFFTSELVDGVSWLKAVQSADWACRPEVEDFLELLAQVLRALEFIHSRGLVHGDIKPENILVRREAAAGPSAGSVLRAKIIDFGLAKKERAFGGKKILGTPYYIAPETILGAPIDRRADLYSLGVLLYHLVTGNPPFRGSSNLAILRGHVEEAPVRPENANPHLPPEIGDLILRLMEKKPVDRPHGALEVIQEVNRSFGLSFPLETAETQRSYVEAAMLVGRERELARLRALFAAATRMPGAETADGEAVAPPAAEEGVRVGAPEEESAPAGRLIILRGEKGLGKRRLVEELRISVQSEGARFLSVQCGGGDDLTRLAGEFTALDRADDPSSGLDFLVAKPEPGVEGERGKAGEPAVDARRALLKEAALRIIRMSQAEAIDLHLHDLHLAGRDVLEVVRNLVQFSSQGRFPESRLLVTATALDRGDVEGSGFQELADTALFRTNAVELKVERLDEKSVARLVGSAFAGGDFPEAFTQRVLDESDGNLDTISQILCFLLDRGKIARTTHGWELSSDYEREDVPGKVRRELKERIERLPPEALRLGIAFACLSDPCDLELAAQLAAIPPRAVRRSLETLRREKILQARAVSGHELYSFVHTSARVLLYSRIPEKEVTALHERAGVLCEARSRALGRHGARDLAHHYLRSGNRLKGIQFGLEAAREYAGELAPLEAIRTYERVVALAGGEDADLARRVGREIAALRFQVGDYRGVLDSIGTLPGVERIRGDGRWEMSAYLEAGRAQARLGRFDEASLHLDTALALAKRQPGAQAQVPALLARAELGFLKGALVESLRDLGVLLGMRGEIKDVMLLSQLYMLLAENHALLNDKERAASYCQLAIRLIDAQHDTSLLAWSLHCRGKLYSFKNQLLEASRQFHLSLLLRRKMSAFDGEADCLFEMGSIQYLLGLPHEARPLLEQSVALYERTGNLPRWVAAQSLFGEVLRLVGDYPRCYKAVGEALRRVGALDTRRLAMQTLLSFAGLCLDRGDLRNAERYLRDAQAQESKGAGTSAGTVRALELLAEHALQGGRLGLALECAAQGTAAAREMGDPVLMARLLAEQSLILCRLGKTGEARRGLVTILDLAKRHDLATSEGRARLLEGIALSAEGKLDAAAKVVASAREIFSSCGSERDLADLWLEAGLLYLARGELEDAYVSLEEGLELVRRLRLTYLEARYHLALGLLETAIGAGDMTRAEESFTGAEALASKAGYVEVLWQVRFHLGQLLQGAGGDDGMRPLRDAFAGLKATLTEIPRGYREPYLAATGGMDLMRILERALRHGSRDAPEEEEPVIVL
jgi:tetratricopeptide (TPR) repeat protein